MFIRNEDKVVVNNINSTNLEYIKIMGLFGINNVTLDFSKEVNIFIGENGLGKTTILNCIYYILKKNFEKLSEINFQTIEVKFQNEKQPQTITSADISKYTTQRHTRNYCSNEDEILYILKDSFEGLNTVDSFHNEDDITIMSLHLARKTGLPRMIARKYVLNYLTNRVIPPNKNSIKGDSAKVKNFITTIDKNIKQKVLYFTTYRRIEDDFSKMLLKETPYIESDSLIQFGMNDVERSIKKILTLIRESSRESFNKMTGVLLNQYSSGDQSQKEYFPLPQNKIDIDMAKIILNRLGSELSTFDKDNIVSLLDSEKIYEANYNHLRNLVSRLIENYTKDKKYDDKIKNFANTCNKYLNGKEFRYNQSELTLYIYLNNPKSHDTKPKHKGQPSLRQRQETISLAQLSSGEKQIVSLFSKLYLESDTDSILIIDEPELSISMKWQKMLLPDVMRSANCKLLLTVTHSPFIFENEFDMDAKEMRSSIAPYKS